MPVAVDRGGVAEGRARALLRAAGRELAAEGMPRLEAGGKLIRPVVALAGLGGSAEPRGFEWAVASVQLAHEASLVHDDIIDGAAERRGTASVVASKGVSAALVLGDHLLTSAYRAAARTGSLAWAEAFARAVERTVAGEARQALAAGSRIGPEAQLDIIAGKSGELFGCAFGAAALLRGSPAAPAAVELGRRIGVVYQRVDDLLDYLPEAGTGKPPLADYRQRHWTWPLDLLGLAGFDEDPACVADRFLLPDASGRTPLRRALDRLDCEIDALRSEVRDGPGPNELLDALLADWRSRVHHAASASLRSSSPRVADLPLPETPADPDGWLVALSAGSRSFRFAARMFPARDRRRVAGVYAFCRTTDDLVDGAGSADPGAVERRLGAWLALARRAYAGERTGVGLLDAVMADAAAGGVPFRYVAELVEGMRMDLRPRTYRDLGELRRYTYRVASVVGLWLTELHGVRDVAVLERAATLGHAMQLTNILRDVGEDLEADRLYIPTSLLRSYGLERGSLEAMRVSGAIEPAWRDLVEELMAVADAWYRDAFEAIPALPPSFQRPVAVAAFVYRGIHDGIRRNGHDNLRRRAYTTRLEKAKLAAAALLELRRSRRRGVFAADRPSPGPGVGDAVLVEGASGSAR